MEEQLIKDQILLPHNFEPYKKIRNYYELYQKFCLVHATGTGKSYLMIQLIKDLLIEKKASKFLYIIPRNRIKGQIIDAINSLPIPLEKRKKILESITFYTYEGLMNQDINELKKYDACIVDEFQHLGAEKWSKIIKELDENGMKIIGLSATPIRDEYTSNPENVADTFFNGNVASYYDVIDAILDGVLPMPEFHTTLIELLGDCEDLKAKVDSGTASESEKITFYQMYRIIKQKIANEHLMPEDLIQKNIKPDGKYIFFVSSYAEVAEAKKALIESFTEEQRENVEFYEVYSGYSQKQNNKSHHSFLNNIATDGSSSSGKLRIMISIDMYTEGVHIPDLDGVLLGRMTKSNRVFLQQIGRALAVRTDKIAKPLIIDLSGNIFGIRNLLKNFYNKLQAKNDQEISISGDKIPFIDGEFFLDSELLDILELFTELKKYTTIILNTEFEDKLIEFIQNVEENGDLILQDDNNKRLPEHISNIKNFWNKYKDKIFELAKTSKMQKEYPIGTEIIIKRYEQILILRENSELKEERILEFIIYINETGNIPKANSNQIVKTPHISNVEQFWRSYREEIYEEISKEEIKNKYPIAHKIIKDRYDKYHSRVEIEDKYIDFFEDIEKHRTIAPQKGTKTRITTHINNIGSFWNTHNEKLYNLALTKELQERYPIASQIIIESYEKILDQRETTVKTDLKIYEFIELVNRVGKIPAGSTKENNKTKHISNLGYFWQSHREAILKEISKEEVKILYPVAFELIIKSYQRYMGRRDFTDVIIEFIDYIENNKIMPPKNSKNPEKTETINDIASFWADNRKKIYDKIQEPEIIKTYPYACQYLKQLYLTYLKTKEQSITTDDKIIEILEYINRIGNIPTKYQKAETSTQHVKNIGNFISNHKLQIQEFICREEIKNKYSVAVKLLGIYFDNMEIDIYYQKLLEFIVDVNYYGSIPPQRGENARSTSNIKSVCAFWNDHRDQLYRMINTEEFKENYPVAFEVITDKYRKYIIVYLANIKKWDNKKRTENIKDVCYRNNIDYERNIDILEHIPYQELVAKIEFLKAHELPITDGNRLNEIFSMSSITLYETYGIDLETLITNYFQIQPRLKKI